MTDQLGLFLHQENDGYDAVASPAASSRHMGDLAQRLPANIYLGTSSWAFAGWRDLVYPADADPRALARAGLVTYAQHPLFTTVSLDRTFYGPLPVSEFRRYAQQVPARFRFVVKAPAACTTPRWHRRAMRRGPDNRHFLDAAYASERFIEPCVAGLGGHLGPLVFQFPPLGTPFQRDPTAFAERLREFLRALPRGPVYAIELRDSGLLSEAYAQSLAETGAQHCVGLHPRLPGVEVQDALRKSAESGTLVVRWNLQAGLRYEEAKARYQPFNRLVDEDRATRRSLARLCVSASRAGQEIFVTINNKAEGSAPLSVLRLAEDIAHLIESPPSPAPHTHPGRE